jgi:hypothetical protein
MHFERAFSFPAAECARGQQEAPPVCGRAASATAAAAHARPMHSGRPIGRPQRSKHQHPPWRRRGGGAAPWLRSPARRTADAPVCEGVPAPRRARMQAAVCPRCPCPCSLLPQDSGAPIAKVSHAWHPHTLLSPPGFNTISCNCFVLAVSVARLFPAAGCELLTSAQPPGSPTSRHTIWLAPADSPRPQAPPPPASSRAARVAHPCRLAPLQRCRHTPVLMTRPTLQHACCCQPPVWPRLTRPGRHRRRFVLEPQRAPLPPPAAGLSPRTRGRHHDC